MPTYDFKCGKCRKAFSMTMPISQAGKKKVACPKCKSTQVRQQFSMFSTVTSKKS